MTRRTFNCHRVVCLDGVCYGFVQILSAGEAPDEWLLNPNDFWREKGPFQDSLTKKLVDYTCENQLNVTVTFIDGVITCYVARNVLDLFLITQGLEDQSKCFDAVFEALEQELKTNALAFEN